MLHAGPGVGNALVAPVCAPDCSQGLRRCYALLSEGIASDVPFMGSLSTMEGVISKACENSTAFVAAASKQQCIVPIRYC
jgi:hypothetical protein